MMAKAEGCYCNLQCKNFIIAYTNLKIIQMSLFVKFSQVFIIDQQQTPYLRGNCYKNLNLKMPASDET